MPLHPAIELLNDARTGGYAIGYFESWNLDSLQGVIDAAEETRSPVITGVNGEFLSSPERRADERLPCYAALLRTAAESASVPVAIIFNECAQDDWIREAVKLGFSQVMLDDPHASLEETARRARDLARFAHENGAIMEAEVGELPCGASGRVTENGALTDPDVAATFVEATGIDVLAVSVGNVHVMVQGQQGLDIRRLRALRRRTDVHLDLHGGTGIPDDSLKDAVAAGVTKVCYGTYLKQRYLGELRRTLANSSGNPHRLLGMGGSEDVMTAGRLAVRDAVLERIELLGCCGKA